LSLADELLTLSDERSYVMWRAHGLAIRGWCLAALGRPDQGVPLLDAGLAEVRASAKLHVPHVLTLFADAYRMAGQPVVALPYVAEAEQLAEATRAKWLQAETLRLRGDLLLITGDRTAAEASYRNAIELARTQGAKLFELRATASLARLWRGEGRRSEAREILAPICGWFTEGFDAPDLVEAKALLEEMSETANGPADSRVVGTAGSDVTG
jgi:predicted ATPase